MGPDVGLASRRKADIAADPMLVLAGLVLLAAPLSHVALGSPAGGWVIARLSGELLAGIALLVPAFTPWSRPAAALLFAIFAIINLVGALAGREDCGCFGFPVHPLITGAVDAILAAALWRGRVPAAVAAMTTAALAVTVLVLGASPGPDARGLVGQRVAAADEGPDTLIAVTRSDCDHCARVLPMMLLSHGAEVRMPPMRLLDLTGAAASPVIAHLTRPVDHELARLLRGAPAPCVVRIRSGVIEEVEAWPVARAQ